MSRFPDLEVLTDAESLAHYGRDWTRFWAPAPERVVFPRSTADVVDLVRWARSEGRALVPSGGRTGLSGGAVAARGEVVVSLEKMRGLVELNTVECSLTAQAGMSVGELQRRALDAGLYYPVDWAAAASSQLGGSIATNAGGIRVLRYGMTRDWVRGLTVVDGRGEVLELNRGLIKNNAGPDLRQLMVGSEGIFGIITEATVGLIPPPPQQSLLLLAFSGLEAVMPALARLQQALTLSAFEFFDRRSVAHVEAALGKPFPLDEAASFYAVVEFDDPDQACQDQALAVFEALVEAEQVCDGLISQSDAQAAELWRWREAISESIAPRTPYKNDLSVRVARVPDFLSDLESLVGRHYPDFEVISRFRGGLVRPYRRRQPAHERAVPRRDGSGRFPPRLRRPEPARVRSGPGPRRQRVGGTRGRPAEAGLPAFLALGGRDGQPARAQAAFRSGRRPQPRQGPLSGLAGPGFCYRFRLECASFI